jgi:hypothetical protein
VNVAREEMQKITVLLPRTLVREAMAASGMGLTPTIRQGLRKVAARPAYEALRRMRGKVKLSIDVNELREDRG